MMKQRAVVLIGLVAVMVSIPAGTRGQDASAYQLSASPIPFEQCPQTARTPDEVFAILDPVVADQIAPGSNDGSLTIDVGVISLDELLGTQAPDVSIDDTPWIRDGQLLTATTIPAVDTRTSDAIQTRLREVRACSQIGALLRLYALYTDHGLEQVFRYARPFLRSLGSIIETMSRVDDDEVYGRPKGAYEVVDIRPMADGRIAALILDPYPSLSNRQPTRIPWIYVFAARDGQWFIDWVFYGQLQAVPE